MATDGYEISPRQVTNNGAQRTYEVIEALTEDDLVAWLDANIPAEVAGFPFADFQADEIEDDIPGQWRVVVSWGLAQTDSDFDVGTSGYRFSYQAPSAHIYQSLATVRGYYDSDLLGFGLASTMFGGAINVVWDEGKQRVEGMKVDPPPEVFTIPYTDVGSVISATYQATVRGLCGKVNSVSYYGAAAGELMLVRAQGDKKGGLWNLEFGFSYIPNTTGEQYGNIDSIVGGGSYSGVAKDGMDLLWPYYLPAKDATAKELIKLPAAIIIDRVWRRDDFAALALPF